VLDWTGIDIRVESRGATRRPDSIQARAIAELQTDAEGWAIILDDDGSGEVADIVAMRVDSQGLLVRLVHCKFSSEPFPGADSKISTRSVAKLKRVSCSVRMTWSRFSHILSAALGVNTNAIM
jgi:hypothetical protein